MLACFPSEQGSAIRIPPVGEEALPGWLDAHPESREWISTVGFKGEPGTLAFLAGDKGRPSGLVSTSTRWAHLDIMAANPAAKPGRPEGGEATGMRALYTYIRQRYA